MIPIEVIAQSTSESAASNTNSLPSLIDLGVSAAIALVVALVTMKVKLSVLETNLENADKKIKTLEDDVKENSKELNQMKGRQEVATQSPLSLTDVGKETFRNSGAEDYIKKNKDILIEKFKNVDGAFDIQEKSKDIVKEILKSKNDASPELKKIKEYLFSEGREVEQFAVIMAIGLRDVVLGEKNIPVSSLHPRPPER